MVKVCLIDNDDFKPVDVKILSPDQVYHIPDAEKKKIFIWAGKHCPKVKLYKAGTLATKFKSVGKFYGYEIEKVDESIEPAKFITETESAPPVNFPPQPESSPEASAAIAADKNSAHCAPTKTFDEVPEAFPPVTPGDHLRQVLAELAEIKELLDKIWQKVKDI